MRRNKMKPFDLKKALAGEPVMLRSGNKALIFYRIPDKFVFDDGLPPAYPLQGIIFNAEGKISSIAECWGDDGRYDISESAYDIIGMVQELKLPNKTIH